jgi:hypothetical protein
LRLLASTFCAPARWSTPINRLGLADPGQFTREPDLSIGRKFRRAAGKSGLGEAPISDSVARVETAAPGLADRAGDTQRTTPAASMPRLPNAPLTGAGQLFAPFQVRRDFRTRQKLAGCIPFSAMKLCFLAT